MMRRTRFSGPVGGELTVGSLFSEQEQQRKISDILNRKKVPGTKKVLRDIDTGASRQTGQDVEQDAPKGLRRTTRQI